MNTIPTRRPLPLIDALRVQYLRWRLNHVEQDIAMHDQNARLYRAEAEKLRVDLAQLGQLRGL